MLENFREVALHGRIEEGTAFTVANAMYDPGDIILDIDSPGGDLAGAQGIINFIRGKKFAEGFRVVARIHQAASAAGWVACCCSSVIVDEDSELMLHSPVYRDPWKNRAFNGALDHSFQKMAADVAEASGQNYNVVQHLIAAETTWRGSSIVDVLGLSDFHGSQSTSTAAYLKALRREANSRSIREPWTPNRDPEEEILDYLVRTKIHQNRLRRAAEERKKEWSIFP